MISTIDRNLYHYYYYHITTTLPLVLSSRCTINFTITLSQNNTLPQNHHYYYHTTTISLPSNYHTNTSITTLPLPSHHHTSNTTRTSLPPLPLYHHHLTTTQNDEEDGVSVVTREKMRHVKPARAAPSIVPRKHRPPAYPKSAFLGHTGDVIC